jgi:hypothetical protein
VFKNDDEFLARRERDVVDSGLKQRVLEGVYGDGQARRQGNALQGFVQAPQGGFFPEQQRENAAFILPVGAHKYLCR